MLLELDRDVTLILIEHDMDVALTVANRVTMLHHGETLLDGTAAEIRASKLVHDLYLGSSQ
jgi:branched-chain amino acid transport system ATP-binding protein